jgi:FixJ family two-component response regulator
MHSCEPGIAKEIFILDDEADVRETLCTILAAGGYKGVCFADETSLLEAIRRRCPAGVLLDVNLPGRSGLDILKDLAVYHAPILMMSGQGDIATAVAAIKDGAIDFLEKPFKAKEVLDRLGKIIASFSRDNSTALQRKISSINFPGREPLTRRERDVLQLVATGSSNKEIAETLGISYRTVEEHRSNIMHKLGVKNIAELLIAVLT